ncbi:MAG: hypothetical protein RL122_1742, partial [Pseudomonadota bacterium]
MKISMRTLLIGTVSAALMAGCSPTGEMTRAQQGALIGAIGGAVVGKNTGDKDKGHTIAGAVVGGLAG